LRVYTIQIESHGKGSPAEAADLARALKIHLWGAKNATPAWLTRAQAEAELRADEAQLAFLRQELADIQLVAPIDAVVRTRLMEPGEMASPQKSVFSLAITDPKWVRAYVAEPDLGKLHTGMTASVVVDSFPDRRFEGWVGFISPVAEFTPKTVQTEELRTSLVYEVRVFVKDPSDQLHLGSPTTVHLSPNDAPPASSTASNARVQ